jgi:hypothetical protein
VGVGDGDFHEWNLVNVGGSWGYVDVTWGDTDDDSVYTHAYLGLTSDEMQRSGHTVTDGYSYPSVTGTGMDCFRRNNILYGALSADKMSEIIGNTYHWGGGLGAGYSLYAATALYFVNPVVDYQDGFVLFAEISSVVVTTSVIFTIIQSAIENLNDFILSKSSASTAVFTDNEWGEIYADALEKGYVAEPEKSWNFKNTRASAAFLYSEDTKNIGMYRENQEKLAGRDVYLMHESCGTVPPEEHGECTGSLFQSLRDHGPQILERSQSL